MKFKSQQLSEFLVLLYFKKLSEDQQPMEKRSFLKAFPRHLNKSMVKIKLQLYKVGPY